MPTWPSELAERGVETSDEWIVERTGIRARHFAAEGECLQRPGAGRGSRRPAAAGRHGPPTST
jgi:3-oxoacyl-[acyl-carrier-protein] synthase-3